MAQTSDMVTSKNVAASDKNRSANGHYVRTPTVTEMLIRLNHLQEWYQPRDLLMQMHISMARLDSPFSSDKDGLENKEVRVKADGRIDYTVDNMPFNIDTIAQAMVADRHPYVDVFPTCNTHTDKRMIEYKRFAQALIDTRLKQNDVMMDMVSKLVVTGWLPTLTEFDPAKLKQGQNPFDLHVLDPLNFYPLLDGQRRVIYGFVLGRVTGAQLIQDYSNFAGVRELIDAELKPPEGTDDYRGYTQYGANFETTEFDLARFYDDVNTCLLIGANDATDAACGNNSVLRKLRDNSKKGRWASAFDTADALADDPYAGIQKHGLGGCPLHLEGCYPEALSPTARLQGSLVGSTNIFKGVMGGRIVYYPALYPVRNDWYDKSKLRNLMYTIIDRYARPTKIIYTENQEYFKSIKQGDTIFMDPNAAGERFETEVVPPTPPELMTMYQDLNNSVKEATFAASTFGGRAGSSARQQDAVQAQGSRREEILIRKTEHSLEKFPMFATRTAIKRGGEAAVFVSGNGRAFDGAYTLDYKAKDLGGFVPSVEVALKAKNGLKDPVNVAAFAALQKSGSFADEFLLGKVLDEPNPAKLIQDAIQEKARTESSVLQPMVEAFALQSQAEHLAEKFKWQEKVQLQTDDFQEKLHHKQIEQDWEQLPQDKQDMVQQSTIARVMQEIQTKNGPQPPTAPPPPPGPVTGGQPSGGPPTPPPPAGRSMTGPPPRPLPMVGGGSPTGIGLPMRVGVPGQSSSGPGPGPMMGMPPRPPMGMMPQPPRPPMPMPMPPPGPLPGAGPLLPPGFAKAPGQADRPVQPLSALGGMGRPGVPSSLNAGAGLHGTPIDTPIFEGLNKAFAPLKPMAPNPMGPGKRKRGRRGGK